MKSERTRRDKTKKPLSALQRLEGIKPIPPKFQFLLNWDPRTKILRFGCGHGENAIFVRSNREVETAIWTDDSAAKLRSACAKRFLLGAPAVDGKRLLSRSQELLRSYLHVQDERHYSLLAVWSIGTYVYQLFSHFGYLFFHSRFPRSGKTRAEEILSHLCFEATVPLNAPTVPTIRDTAAEGRTLVLDTLERWKGKSPEAHCAAMELLDAGFRKGGTVVKMVPAGDGKWKRESFPVYAPYILAAIERESLTDTALDRAFAIEMHRKAITVKKRKYSFDRCETECLPLRDDFYIWALENARILSETYTSCELEAEVDALELNDRAADIWKPLLAVAHVLRSGRGAAIAHVAGYRDAPRSGSGRMRPHWCHCAVAAQTREWGRGCRGDDIGLRAALVHGRPGRPRTRVTRHAGPMGILSGERALGPGPAPGLGLARHEAGGDRGGERADIPLVKCDYSDYRQGSGPKVRYCSSSAATATFPPECGKNRRGGPREKPGGIRPCTQSRHTRWRRQNTS